MNFTSKIKKIAAPIKNLLDLNENLSLVQFQSYLSTINEEADLQYNEIQNYINTNNNNDDTTTVCQIIDGTISYYNNNATELKYTFAYCDSLQNIEMPNCLSLSNNFNNCYSLQSINLPKCSIFYGSTFANCSSLISVTLPECQILGPHTFNQCVALQSVSLPKCTIIDGGAFQYCSSLQSINLPECTTIESGAFSGCSINIRIPKISLIGTSMFKGAKIISLEAQNCLTIYSAFQSQSQMRMVDLPNCRTVYSYAFQNCSSLQSVSLPKCTTIGSSAFEGCSSLQSIDLPKCTEINNCAFSNCISLQSINLPECTTISANAFYGCSELNSIDLQMCETIGSSAFCKCFSLQSINLSKCTAIRVYAFSSCISLQSINLPECTIIENAVFYKCSSLQSADLPKCTTLNYSNFYGCTSLQSVSLPECTYVGNHVFSGCTSLQSISLPKCTYIGQYAFRDCTSLKTINLLGDNFCSLSNLALAGTLFENNPEQQALIIKVQSGLFPSYLADSRWASYSQYIIPGEPRTPSFEQNINFKIALNTTRTLKIPAIVDVMPVNTTVTCNSPNVTISNIQVIQYRCVQFDVYAEAEENIQFTITCDFEEFDSISTTIDAVVATYIAPTWEVEVLNTTYGFALNANNYYESNNKGKTNSFAMCKVNIDSKEDTTMYVDCINYAESNYDYGLLSLLDTELNYNYSADSSGVKQSFKGSQSASIQTVTYDVPAGEHFIFVKFIKDSSTNSNNDSLQFTIRFAE